MNEYIYLGIVEETAENAVMGHIEAQRGQPAVCVQDTPGVRPLVRIEQRNKFSVGETIEIMKPDGSNLSAEVLAMYNGELEPVESCPHSRQVIWLELSKLPERYDILRKKADSGTGDM